MDTALRGRQHSRERENGEHSTNGVELIGIFKNSRHSTEEEMDAALR